MYTWSEGSSNRVTELVVVSSVSAPGALSVAETTICPFFINFAPEAFFHGLKMTKVKKYAPFTGVVNMPVKITNKVLIG